MNTKWTKRKTTVVDRDKWNLLTVKMEKFPEWKDQRNVGKKRLKFNRDYV